MFRNGLTLIELLIVLGIISILVMSIFVGIGGVEGIAGFGTEYNAKVVEKWIDPEIFPFGVMFQFAEYKS